MERQDQARDAPRVLYIDDEPMNLRVVRDMLAHVGLQVDCADDAASGLTMLATKPYDAVLLDIQMPRMDGIAALAALRAGSGPNARTPVVAVTADDGLDAAQYRFMGFSGLVAKPVSLKTLSRGVLEALSGSGPTTTRPQHRA
ncbi:response regulator [Phenylobacterium sp.]|jgi:CheY-like chemotaxis protein|uniref:response regulator n=1 Tax=Phenylobacterium sp. TaxID=1871053 RepID=UPI002F94BD0F